MGTEKIMAKIIKPMVEGNLNTLWLIKLNNAARERIKVNDWNIK